MKKSYIKETKAELRKVIWPTKQDVTSGTGVVVVVVAIFGLFILLFDFVSSGAITEVLKYKPTQEIVEENTTVGHEHSEDETNDSKGVEPSGENTADAQGVDAAN